MNDKIIVRNPYSDEIIGELSKPTIEEIHRAFVVANNFWKKEFKYYPAYRRAEILYKVANRIADNVEDLAISVAREGGKPLKDARVEVRRAINTVKMSADYCLNLSGEQIPMDNSAGTENHLAFTIKEPIGVVLAISAFNHPLNLICHQVATAIAAGNTVVLKPAEKTPLTARLITQYFYDAGLPNEALQFLPITGKETQEILGNDFIRYVSFIGNADIGWQIRRLVQPGVKIMLEHGGTAAAVLDSSANLDNAIQSIVRGSFYHSGQVCVSTQILYIHQNIYNAALKSLIEKVSKLITGDACSDKTDCGPLITPAVVERMKFLVEDAIQKEGKVLIGGTALPNNCFEPTLIDNLSTKMMIYNDEVFGPILGINSFDNINDILEKINNSKFAFQTAIYTQDIDFAMYYARNVEQKAVIINDSTAFRVDWMPFGGYKHSGYGTGGIKYVIEDMLENKLIVINNKYIK